MRATGYMDDLLPGFEDEVKMRKRRSVSSLQPRVCVRARDAQYVYGCVEPRRTCVTYSVTQCVRREEACEARLSHGHLCGKLCVFGGLGHSDSGRIDLVEVYSPASNSWARAADLPSPIDVSVAVAL